MSDRIGRVVKYATGEVLLARVHYCASFGCRLRGLTFRAGLEPDEGLLLVEPRESRLATAIHMLFVFFPLAVFWLDSGWRVVDARLARPWRPAYAPRAPARYVLEANPELLSRVSPGDRLRFEELREPS